MKSYFLLIFLGLLVFGSIFWVAGEHPKSVSEGNTWASDFTDNTRRIDVKSQKIEIKKLPEKGH